MSFPQLLALAKLIAAALVTTSGALLAASLHGAIVLPPTVVAVLTSIVSIGAGLGIASGGVESPKPAAPPEVKP